MRQFVLHLLFVGRRKKFKKNALELRNLIPYQVFAIVAKEKTEKNIITNKLQQYSLDPDYIYLAEKIKIDVDCLYFDSRNKMKQNETKQNEDKVKLTSKINSHIFSSFD